MVIFYVYMREWAKKSPFCVAYTQIDEETFACEGKNFANRLTHICIYVTEPKKLQPQGGGLPPDLFGGGLTSQNHLTTVIRVGLNWFPPGDPRGVSVGSVRLSSRNIPPFFCRLKLYPQSC